MSLTDITRPTHKAITTDRPAGRPVIITQSNYCRIPKKIEIRRSECCIVVELELVLSSSLLSLRTAQDAPDSSRQHTAHRRQEAGSNKQQEVRE